MKNKVFSGVCTALITPFDENGNVDFVALRDLIENQIETGVSALLVLGTTGESPTLTESEKLKIIFFAKKVIDGRCKLIVGTGSNNTKTAIFMTQQAQIMGADACLVITPYYNKCTQRGLIEHFTRIAKSTKLPIIVYNVPSRTGVNLAPETLLELGKIENIVGVKEANDNIGHILSVFAAVKGKLAIYSGNDNLNHVFKSLGGDGIISVLSNAYCKQVVDGWKNLAQSLKTQQKFFNMCNLLFVEPNPIPIKYVMSKMNKCKNVLRLPLTVLEKQNREKLDAEMEKLK
ncbi:MAG: 4-hydroxy-tetrahydrodipicolinate synthase [Clostridia bacterium]|nr:4-hydroxy-tetrahydrodipicolinate synthase [Clostridia bacterium]